MIVVVSHMRYHSLYLAALGIVVGASISLADTPSSQKLGEWSSPDGRFLARAVVNATTHEQIFTIGPVSKDVQIIADNENQEIAFVPNLAPVCVGIWSGDSTKFCLYEIQNAGSGMSTIGTTQFAIWQQPPAFPTDKPKSQFVRSKSFYPDIDLELLQDRLGTLDPENYSRTYGPSGIFSARWGKDGRVVVEHYLQYSIGGPKDKVWSDYSVHQSADYDMTPDGFQLFSAAEPVVEKINPKTKERKLIELPKITPTLDLLAAIRAGDSAKAHDLLAHGANVNAQTRPYTPLSLAIQLGKDELIGILLDAGATVGVDELCSVVSTQSSEKWNRIFKTASKADDDSVLSVYGILFYGPPKGTKSEQDWLAAMQKVTDRFIILHGNFNAHDENTGDTPLITAVRHNVPKGTIEMMLRAGASPAERNKAGESASDVAATLHQISDLELLDRNHIHADLLKQSAIPADSPFLGPWTAGGYIATLTLSPDSSGTYVSMFGGRVSWEQIGNTIDIQIHVTTNSGNKVLHAIGRMREDGKAILIKFIEDSAKLGGENEVSYEKGPGDTH